MALSKISNIFENCEFQVFCPWERAEMKKRKRDPILG